MKIINIKDIVSIENSIIGIRSLKPLIFFDITVIDSILTSRQYVIINKQGQYSRYKNHITPKGIK